MARNAKRSRVGKTPAAITSIIDLPLELLARIFDATNQYERLYLVIDGKRVALSQLPSSQSRVLQARMVAACL